MSERDWARYLNGIQRSYYPVAIGCIGVLLALSAFRDFVFTDFQPPMWLNLLNGVGLIAVITGGVLAAINKIGRRDVNPMLLLCCLVMCIKPAVLVSIDNSPGSLVLATVIFALGLIFLSLRYLIFLQSFTLICWLAVSRENFVELQYFATFVAAVISGSLGMWLQQIRINQIQKAFEIEARVEELETIVPMCTSCKKTQSENGEWMSVEQYIEARNSSAVSPRICPDCS